MKKFSLIALAFTLFIQLTTAKTAHAYASATSVRLLYSAGSVGLVNWNPLIYSTVKAVKAISVMNTNPSDVAVGVALANAAANTETVQFYVPGYASASVLYPISLSQGYRVSIQLVESAGSAGRILLDAFHN